MQRIKSKIRNSLITLLPIILLFLLNCKEKECIKNTTDPYAKSFWGRNIKKMITKYCRDSTCLTFDTLIRLSYFDKPGNIVTEEDPFSIRRMAYDSNHFITRDWNSSDVSENLVYSYRYDNKFNCILVYRTELNHIRWEFTKKDLVPGLTDTIRLQLDDHYRVISEGSVSNKLIAQYYYKDNLLIKKTSYFLGNISETTTYTYNKNILSEITIVGHLESFVIKHYFSKQGLIHHSTRELLGHTRITMYDFEFY